MKNIIIIFNLIFITILQSCNTNQANKETQSKIETQNEELVSLKENTLQEFDSIKLINNADEYYQITNTINSIRMPGIDFKEVDFSTNSVILINMIMDNYYDIEIYTKTNPETATIFYSGIHYKNNQNHLKKVRLVKLIEIPKTKKIESFRPMH